MLTRIEARSQVGYDHLWRWGWVIDVPEGIDEEYTERWPRSQGHGWTQPALEIHD